MRRDREIVKKDKVWERNARLLYKKEAGKLVHIACFRLVPSPRATVVASWCGFHYLSSIYWTLLEPTLSSAAILAEGQWREQRQQNGKGRICRESSHSVGLNLYLHICTVRHSWKSWIHWSLTLSFVNAQHYLYVTHLKTHLVYLAAVRLLTVKSS